MPLEKTAFCEGCWRQMHVPIPIRGPLSFPLRALGIRVSQMHPNLCTICETMFTRVKRQKQVVIQATVLFADMRGYTALSEDGEADQVSHILHEFYDECASAVWELEGIINKFIGDAVLAIFNFPLTRADHVQQAVQSGEEILRRCREKKKSMALGDRYKDALGVGVGIHTGKASIGEVGTAYKDFTIVGPVVNTASRLQGAARAGEILVSEDVYREVKDRFPQAEARECQLKGIEKAMCTYVLHT